MKLHQRVYISLLLTIICCVNVSADFQEIESQEIESQEIIFQEIESPDCGVEAPVSKNMTSKYDPLVAVVLMVKNEEHVMRATLEPLVQGGIDAIVVFDTGSTDNTVHVTEELFKEWGIRHGHITQEEFIDFATSRNAALEFAQKKLPGAGFLLMPDAEWCLHNSADLIEFCREKIDRPDQAYGYLTRIVGTGLDFYVTRLMRAHRNIKFAGAVHEYVVAGVAEKVPGHVFFELKTTALGAEKTRKRWERDKEILLREHEKNPLDPRTVFYLAQTYDCLGELEKAYNWYQKRIDMPGWDEENFMAAYRQAQVAERMAEHDIVTWSHVLELYLKAFEMRPNRAEPLIRVAKYYLKKGKHQLAYIFALRALKIAYPTDVLFVDKNLYDFDIHDIVGQIGWYIGEYQEGEQQVIKALQARPSATYLLRNLEFYQKRTQALA